MPSQVGELTLCWACDALSAIYFEGDARLAARETWERDDVLLAPARRQLTEYFAGARTTFDVPLRFEGTPFQRRVWQALTRIPFGTTMSYGELAKQVGTPKGSRAVGGANGRNPLVVIVPCHRVIGAGGALTGFGGGIPRKRWLLDHEGRGRHAA